MAPLLLPILAAIGLSLVTSLPGYAEPLPAHVGGVWPDTYQSFVRRPSAPTSILVGEDGRRISLSEFKGKIIILNFWATWCGPCLNEMPALDRLAKELPSDRFTVLTVTEDDGGIAVAKVFLERLELRATTTLADPGNRLKRAFEVRGLPTTFVILPDGTVHGRVEGPIDWDQHEVKDFLLSIR